MTPTRHSSGPLRPATSAKESELANEYGLAGDRITMTETEDGTTTISFDDKGTGRVCGDCTLCCKLLPVPVAPLFKPAGERCQHVRVHKGCTIYKDRPFACKVFACRWLADPTTADLPRPDRAHYVIDPQPDYITAVPNDGSPSQKVSVLQVWVDPAFPDAWRTPSLRGYMLRFAQRFGAATIIRFSSTRAVTVLPPPLNKNGEWAEVDNGILARNEEERRILERDRRPR
jgi:hypothetical protein